MRSPKEERCREIVESQPLQKKNVVEDGRDHVMDRTRASEEDQDHVSQMKLGGGCEDIRGGRTEVGEEKQRLRL